MKFSYAISLQPTKFQAVGAGDWQKQISLLAHLGYDGVELAVRNPAQINKIKLERILRKNNLKVSAIGTGQVYLSEGLSLSDRSSAIRKKAVFRIKQHVSLAQALRSPVVLGLIRGNKSGGADKKSMDHLKESCRKICDEASRYAVPIVLEPINRYETCFLNNIEEALKFIRQIGYRGLKVLPDTFHMNIEEADICRSIEKAKNYIGHIHFADSNRKYPGAGHVDFISIISKLKQIGYAGFISAEILPLPNFEITAKKFMFFMNKKGRAE